MLLPGALKFTGTGKLKRLQLEFVELSIEKFRCEVQQTP